MSVFSTTSKIGWMVGLIILVCGQGAMCDEFLVPSPGAIPHEFPLFARTVTEHSYGLRYKAVEDGAELFVTEQDLVNGESYQRQLETLDAMGGNTHGPVPLRQQYFQTDLGNGVVFEMSRSTPRNLLLIFNDKGCLLRISSRDGSRHRFQPEELIEMVRHFTKGSP